MTALQDADLLVEVNGVPHRVSRDEGGLIRSHGPGVVVAIPVSAGDEVQAGDVVAVTESMKMESSLTATVPGRVREVLVSPNSHVPAGKPLLQIDPVEDEAAGDEGERVRFELDEAPDDATRLAELEWLVLGYDFTPDEVKRVLRGAPDDLAAERRLLELYADVRTLNRPHADGLDDEDELGSPQEHLHAFLRSLDADAEGLPDRYVAHLDARARPLRDRGARAHRRARGRRLPPVPLPAARADRARGACAPCSPATSSAATRSRATTPSAPCSTAWRPRSRRASPRWPSSPARCAGAAATSPGSPPAARPPTTEMADHLAALRRGLGRSRRAHGRAGRVPAPARPRCCAACPATPAR